MSVRPPIVVLAGPTASGKSALALELGERLGAEIVNADSQQVYRGLDVGTAKPGESDREKVPHHLLDVASIDEQLTAARFVTLADEAIRGIAKRGRLPLVVGGSGLWLRALLWGLADTPPRDPAIRARLEAEAASKGTSVLHQRLARVDPESASRLHPNDLVRIVRALEVQEMTGRPLSDHHQGHRFEDLRYPHRLLALLPDRTALRRRIGERTEIMLQSGWVPEVRSLLDAGVRPERLAKVLGYAEVVRHVQGQLDREELLRRITSRTWRYAKRQVLWLRKEPSVEWLRPPLDSSTLAAELRSWLHERATPAG